MAQPFVEPCDHGIIAAEPCPREGGREIPPRRRRMVLAACVLASSMAFIDGSALTVALPQVRADFGAGLASVQWVLNGYVLALAALTLIGGALADAYGKTRMLVVGCVLFALSSIACALAPSVEWLIAFRVLQGVGAAILTPTSLALIGATYPRSERNRAIAVWAAASALTTAAGPVLGGWLTENFGWPYVFWINPPLAFVAVVILLIAAPRDRGEARQFDLPGAILLAAGLAAIAWGLSQIGPADVAVEETPAGPSPGFIVLILGLGCIGLIIYALWERVSDHPMTPPRLVQNRPLVGLNLETLAIYSGLSIMFFLAAFDLVDRRALSPTGAGLAFLPFTLAVGLLSGAFGRVADSIGPRTMLIIGPAGAALAYLWMALGRDASLVLGVIAPMGMLGVSFAALVAPLTASVLSSVDQSDEGLASGINNAVSRIAQLAGIALAAGVGTLAIGYQLGLAVAALASAAGALVVVATIPQGPAKTDAPDGDTEIKRRL